jgi:hypothetical protein
MLTNDTPFGRGAFLSIFLCLENSLDRCIPHHQSDSWQPHGVCLIVGDEGDETVSCFVLRPLGGPGSPDFQSSYPCLIVGAGVVQANVGQKLVNSNIFKSFFYQSSLANFHVSDA